MLSGEFYCIALCVWMLFSHFPFAGHVLPEAVCGDLGADLFLVDRVWDPSMCFTEDDRRLSDSLIMMMTMMMMMMMMMMTMGKIFFYYYSIIL